MEKTGTQETELKHVTNPPKTRKSLTLTGLSYFFLVLIINI